MKNMNIAICSIVITLGMASVSAHAEKWNSMSYYQAPVYYPHYMSLISPEQVTELRNYLNYEEREPCQHYRIPPAGFYTDKCHLLYRYPEAKAAEIHEGTAEAVNPADVLSTYEITFAFDSSRLDNSAHSVMDQIAAEIIKFNPREVVISGYTDRAGPADYNVGLSRQRAATVSQGLTQRGVVHRILESRAYGESNSAVETEDGVALLDNRRVIIQFLK